MKIGQRYMSEAEPELGLGMIAELAGKTLIVDFPAVQQQRRYNIKSAPIKRICYQVDDEICSNEGLQFTIKRVEETDHGLLVYFGENEEEVIIEIDLKDTVSFHSPEEKIFNGQSDSFSFFNLRYETLELTSWLGKLNVRGFLGPRLGLIDHQYYIANEVVKHPTPRVLLADEVGLGKTIEAGLILHKLLTVGRLERVLIVAPNTLIFQWFLEMLRKYNLVFTVVDQSFEFSAEENPFDETNLVITSLQMLCNSSMASQMILEAQWDMLVVDEAHKIEWREAGPSESYSIIEDLSKKTPGLLLLTATPEMDGAVGHFSRLKLIDPDKFHNFENYLENLKTTKAASSVAKKLLNQSEVIEAERKKFNISGLSDNEALNILVDRHGSGRTYFRNSRKNLDNVYDFFPTRKLIPYQIVNKKPINREESDDINGTYKLKIDWLMQFLEEKRKRKVLLICQSKQKILKIQSDLAKMTINNKVAIFHSDLSLMARDRQAAYFLEPDGANLLLCTEIGSEGRNFQFANNLVLFDMPLNADLLEQRIGRLDRIGQKLDVLIHVPYVQNTWEEIVFNWYHRGLNAFEQSSLSANKVSKEHNDEFLNALENVGEYLESHKLDQLIEKTHHALEVVRKEIEDSKDILLEINSFRKEEAKAIINQVKEVQASHRLKEYLEKIYSHFGVDVEDLNEDSQFIKPGDNMFIPSFPYLTNEGFSYTFDRQRALEREDLTFMSWDHPMVLGIMDLFLGQEFGNATIASRKKIGKSNAYLECFFLLQVMAPPALEMNRFLPPTAIRVLVDLEGKDHSEKWSKEKLDGILCESSPEVKERVRALAKNEIKALLKKSESLAVRKGQEFIEEASASINSYFVNETRRLENLKTVNKYISDNDLEQPQKMKHLTLEYLNHKTIELDSLRFII